MSDAYRISKNNYDIGEVASALQKAVRRGDEKSAAYWAYELCDSGKSAYLWRRLFVIAAEDISAANPAIIGIVHDCYEAFQVASKNPVANPEMMVVIAAIYHMCRSKKRRDVDHLKNFVHYKRQMGGRLDIPDYAQDCHTPTGKELGRGWDHFCEVGALINNKHAPHEWEEEMCKVCPKRQGLIPECDGSPIKRRLEVEDGHV